MKIGFRPGRQTDEMVPWIAVQAFNIVNGLGSNLKYRKETGFSLIIVTLQS